MNIFLHFFLLLSLLPTIIYTAAPVLSRNERLDVARNAADSIYVEQWVPINVFLRQCNLSTTSWADYQGYSFEVKSITKKFSSKNFILPLWHEDRIFGLVNFSIKKSKHAKYELYAKIHDIYVPIPNVENYILAIKKSFEIFVGLHIAHTNFCLNEWGKEHWYSPSAMASRPELYRAIETSIQRTTSYEDTFGDLVSFFICRDALTALQLEAIEEEFAPVIVEIVSASTEI